MTVYPMPFRQDAVLHVGRFVIEQVADRCWVIDRRNNDERVVKTFLYDEHGREAALQAAIDFAQKQSTNGVSNG